MARPTILLLDEPSLGLAPKIVDLVFETLAEIRRRGVTVLLVEQRAQRTVAFADRTYVLSNGELRMTLTPADATDTDRLIAAYWPHDLPPGTRNAVTLGSTYALIAVGIGLVFGVMRLVNFAYGQLIMVARSRSP